MDTNKERHDPYAALKISKFRLFIGGRLCITLALQMQAMLVGWQIYEITGDKLALGLIGLAEFLPALAVSLLGAGHVADVFNRKKIIVSCLFFLVASAFFLFYLNITSRCLCNNKKNIYYYHHVFVLNKRLSYSDQI